MDIVSRITNLQLKHPFKIARRATDAYRQVISVEIDGGIGPRLRKDVIASYITAESFFKYNKKFMPYNAGNSLQEQEYWDITAYLLTKHNLIAEDLVLGPETVAGISLKE